MICSHKSTSLTHKFYTYLKYFAASSLLLTLIVSCSKKDCGEPCNFVMQCARDNVDISSYDTKSLTSACQNLCSKYNAAFIECYNQSTNSNAPCRAYVACAENVYEKGSY